MAIVQTQCTSFKLQLLQAVHDFTTDTFKIALYTSAASLGASTTVYAATNEVVATGYTAGGNTLTGVSALSSGTTAYVDFADTTWTTSTTARGALIYNSTKANKAVAVLDFGADKTSTNTFTVQMPPNSATDALIRIA